ncbi:MAG TPA: cytochrome c, partial [Elusimicrobiota bacterium]|nr:cytochrome c [Elusimicrobiota bacterium]
AGKKGEELYRADCAMCHEHHKMGLRRIGPSAEEMAGKPVKVLQSVIENGAEGSSMPAFHRDVGGPLSDKDVESLVKFIRSVREEK